MPIDSGSAAGLGVGFDVEAVSELGFEGLTELEGIKELEEVAEAELDFPNKSSVTLTVFPEESLAVISAIHVPLPLMGPEKTLLLVHPVDLVSLPFCLNSN